MTFAFVIVGSFRPRDRVLGLRMAEVSLLCVNCLAPPPAGLPKWQCCVRCAKEKLQATYYCSQECQRAD